ncbi:MAG: hypothetical protein KatS3mg060_1225 [Dehalococcoidia bacterium]|nr:MAG: hypothetical protein KatS3mg060_1225 [Dehalococcoidia bacterium]
MTERSTPPPEQTESEAIAYALGALETAEAAAFEARLETDPIAQRAFADALRTLDLLAESVEPVPAPPALRNRVLGAARAGLRPARPAWFRRPATWALAAAAAIILMLGAWNVQLQRQLAAQAHLLEQQASELAARDRLVQAIRQGDRVVALAPSAGSRASGSVVVPSGAQPLLLVGELPPIGPEQVYQIWIVRGNQPLSAGIFRDPSQPVPIAGMLQPGDAVAITIEPGPNGSPGPTTPPLAIARA